MPFHIAIQPDLQILTLEGGVTIRNVLDLSAALAEGLADDLPMSVDTKGLEDIDTCVLQLLCSLRKAVTKLSFINPSEVFVGAVERCGLRRELLGTGEGK